MRRWLLLLSLLPPCAGCLCYAYPTLSYTPELAVDNKDGSAHAFRVDIDRAQRTPMPNSAQYTLTRMPIDSRGLIPSQLELAAVNGVWNPLGIGDTKEHERNEYTLTVRFYRPGFHTMEVKSWDKSRRLAWSPAATLADQEKAIDDLLADPAAASAPIDVAGNGPLPGLANWWMLKDQTAPKLGLQPGSIAPGQRQTLHFAASEYGRLANSPAAATPNMQGVRERLQQKAIWLQRYADQPGQ